MKKSNSDYQKLNWLLADCLEAERRYFNASEDIQDSVVKRFLNHESVNRNRYAAILEEKLLQAGIKPQKFLTKKGNLHRNWLEIKNVLTTKKWKRLLNSCIQQDERCLDRYTHLLWHSSLPPDILLVLQQQRNGVVDALDKAILLKKRPDVPEPQTDPKVRKLKAM